jgi:DNA processing protein
MTEYWVWLSQIPYIGPVTANRLIQKFGDPKCIYHACTQEISERCCLSEKQRKMLEENRSLEKAYEIVEQCKEKNINILTLKDALYDPKAKKADAPITLYYRGDLRKMNHAVGIVGARRCTREARQTAIEITKEFSQKNVAVVSGMAKGIDAYAHTACIKAGGYTIAILANGLDICYPKEHNILMGSIIENGALISEYPPGIMPSQYRFPRRNRLISAWTDELVVIGAGRGSGALITAEYAWKYGNKVTEILN